AGYRLGNYASRKTETAHEGTGTIEAAIFALLGLLLGFTFARRQLIVQEANAIGSAYLRLDLVPAERPQEMRVLFRQYLDARLEAYEKLPDLSAAEQELDQATKLQQEIWSRAVAASREDPTQNLARLLLPALNDMIDVTTAVALLSGLMAGYNMAKRKSRSWFHVLLYSAA